MSTSAVMTAAEFAAKAKDIAENYKTTYMLGPWGWPTTQAMIDRACNSEANGAKNKTWLSYANAIKGKGFIFYCVGLVKGILWGWSADLSKNYGGAGYACNGVPDIGADSMISKCPGASTDFSNIVPGEVVWMSGHIGIYIGGGVVVESTPKWKWGVQKSTILNVSKTQVSGTVGTRTWTKHGKLPYVSYAGAATTTQPSTTGKAAYTVGKDNEETTFNFCREVLGLNVAATVGVLANIGPESNFKTGALGDGGTSYGICQWHNTRYTNLKNWCGSNGKDYTALDGQLWYMKYELEGSYKAVLNALKAVPNTAQGAYDAAYTWCMKFEVPANTVATSEKRGALARDAYWPKYSGSGVSSSTGSSTGGGSTSSGAVGSLKVGDIVTFTGNKHYSNANAASGPTCKPGKAKVTELYPAGKHPVHLVAEPGSGSTVYGWVDVADISGASSSIQKGSKVRVNAGAKTYTGGGLASFVYTTVYEVIQINGDRVVIGLEGKTTAAMNVKDLTLA